MKVEATALVDFGSIDSTGILVNIILDDEKNIDADGEVISSFSPGDTIFFKVQFSKEVEIGDLIPTDGSTQSFGIVSRTLEEENVFASRESANPDKFVLTWIPSSAVSISYTGRQGILASRQASNKTREYTADIETTPFIAVFDYKYNCHSFALITPPVILAEGDTYHIVIVLYIIESKEVESGCSS